MKISFDFDGTLTQPIVFHMAALLNQAGHDIWIITSRLNFDKDPDNYPNKDLYNIANQLKIPHSKIVFTNQEWKAPVLEEYNIEIHFDDNDFEKTMGRILKCPTQFIIV